MNGRDLTLGALAGLAVAGMVAQRRRGSRELTSLTAPQGLSPAQPWKGLVGAAKGGPSLESWKESLARFPFDLSIEVVGSKEAEVKWLQQVQRPGPGKLRVCVWAYDTRAEDSSERNRATAIQSERKGLPSDALALFSPFTIAHRLFDMSSTAMSPDPNGTLDLSAIVEEVLLDGLHPDEAGLDKIQEWADADCEDAAGLDPQKNKAAWNKAMRDCTKSLFARCRKILRVYAKARELFTASLLVDEDETQFPEEMESLLEEREDPSHLAYRVLVSLCCPTAAGRLLRLTDYSQAMADCYATHIASGRNPLVKLTVRDLTHFSVDAQVKRWLATASAKKATEGQIAKYRRELERVAVPVLDFLRDTDHKALFTHAVKYTNTLHAQRADLIEAANGVFAIQRVVVL